MACSRIWPSDAGQRAPSPAPFETDKPVVLMFGLMRPYKGIDVLLEAWRGVGRASADRGRRAVDRRDAEDGHLRAAGHRPARTCGSCRASSATTSCPPTSSGPISSCCPTCRPTSRVCCSRRWRLASRCCSATWEVSPRSPPPARRGSCRRATPLRSATRCESCWRDRATLTEMCVRARAAATWTLLLGGGRGGAYRALRAAPAGRAAAVAPPARTECAQMRTALEIVFWVSAVLIVWTQVGYALVIAGLARLLAPAPRAAVDRRGNDPIPPIDTCR